MKIINKALHILAVAGSVLAIAFVFFPFFEATAAGGDYAVVGSQLLFHSKLASGQVMHVSMRLVFVMLVNILTLAYSITCFSAKHKVSRYLAAGFATLNAIYTLVYVCGKPQNFIDMRPLKSITEASFGIGMYLCFGALCLTAVAAVAHLFINDKLIAMETGAPTIMKRVVTFLKDYKSEIHKIVWPDAKSVLNNTIIVLVLCLIIGLFIWLLDFGLGELLSYLWSL